MKTAPERAWGRFKRRIHHGKSKDYELTQKSIDF